jgi:hypothetical protein
MTRFLYTTVLLATLVISSTTSFGHKGKPAITLYDYQDKARVINVEPHYADVNVVIASRQCLPTLADRSIRQDGLSDYTATALGTVIDAYPHQHSIHNDQKAYNSQPCIQTAVHHPRQQRGYNVTYRYHGQTYQKKLNYRPGKFIAVDITVSPSPRYY